ncbi:protein phosphatase [Streptomyces lunaelactis]|uniref:Protein phosphatase n=1 Tax=Streptomyces lunaelactis TaxID=1535768 RepID=A0A2R4SWR6_9ACTN|nr:SpoIIE family protein phosphatase [Streptomyces lunaelactis]AVZ71321.1 protein phosphatase [Streptomyces lunaelactis]NUK83999.1 SpoIIE family protein phosphatase [Streptomyces lunaelactis]
MSAWNTAESADFRGPLDITRAATAVLDAQDTIIGWSRAAEDLLGYPQHEIIGKHVDTVLPPREDPEFTAEPESAAARRTPLSGSEIRVALHRDGRELLLATAVSDPPGTGTAARVLVVTELEGLRLWESRLALLQGLATQSPVGLGIYDTDLRLTWCNAAYEREIGRPFAEFRGMRADELYSEGRFLTKGYPQTLAGVMQHVIDTGEPILDLHFYGEPPGDPGKNHLWSCAYYRLQDADGHVFGVCEDAFDITDRYEAQKRLALLVEAGRAIGTVLDVVVTAEEITEVAVPDFADTVTVDLAEEVVEGEVLGAGRPAETDLVRVASRPAPAKGRGDPGESPQRSPVAYPPGSPQHRSLASGGLVLEDNTLVVPLRAGGSTLGLVTFLRDSPLTTFDDGEVALADELAARTAVCIDNARRFTRERMASLALQRQLLPQHLPQQSAGEVAYRYLPTDDVTGVGGDWFDVIALSGTRVGLVVGDVVGHGLQAAATMGRLRTTVRALAQLDLSPDELLTRLDDLVSQSAEDQSDASGALADPHEDDATGATCLYAVYDPVSRRCVMARAGHLPPAIVDPDGRLSFPELPAGPPLGLGGLPFESMEIELPVGSLVALFTDGLVEARDRDIDEGLEILGRVLGDRGASLEELCDSALSALLPDGTTPDDIALLLVRTRELDAGQVADWELPAEPVAVGHARELAIGQLHKWGLEELSFSTELVVSELVTNAVRHAGGPLHLRLIRDRTLLCEVADAGHTSPHLRHSAEDDEGGRGLFIVAQLVHRWGTRYTQSGKTIWTEQAFPSDG